jgi:hypothetical protein
MTTHSRFSSQQIDKPGRYAVTVVCADDLTDDEIIELEAVIEAKVCLLQQHRRGYTADYVALAAVA